MFCVEIAGIPIGIDNQYAFVRALCQGYETDKPPVFTVRAAEEEIRREQKGDSQLSLGYCESLCIYRRICCKLAAYDALLMHSSVIAVDGVAYAFAAPSGTGKTTHTRLWLQQFGSRARVINGDKPIYRFLGDRLYAFGTPWQGKEGMGNNIRCPVQAICFLEQSPENEIRPLQAKEINRRIFRQILIPKDQQEFERFWPLLERLVTSVDFYLLKCNRTPEAARLAYQTMRAT